MNSVRGLILTDYDGSYADQGGKVSSAAKRTKSALLKQGWTVSLVSGRSVKEVEKFINRDHFSPVFTAELGAIVYYQGDIVINHGELDNVSQENNLQEFIRVLDRSNSHDAMFETGAVDLMLDTAHERGEKLEIFTPKDGRPGDDENNIMEKKRYCPLKRGDRFGIL